MLQERTASPLRCTVQAPHSATPQPNFVPVRPARRASTTCSGIDGSPSNVRSCPFTFTLTIRPSAGGSFFIAGCRLSAPQRRRIGYRPRSTAMRGHQGRACCSMPRFPPFMLSCCFLVSCEGCSGNQTNHARDGSKRVGVNKTNSKTRMLDRRPFVESRAHIFVRNPVPAARYAIFAGT